MHRPLWLEGSLHEFCCSGAARHRGTTDGHREMADRRGATCVLAPASPGFARAVAASPCDVIRQSTALHPYSAVLMNDTDQDVFFWILILADYRGSCAGRAPNRFLERPRGQIMG